MSIAILNQVYDETRRLAIAGSNLAKGDFRLKKLVAPLEKAGTKAPVFGQVAKAIANLVDGPEKQSPQALLDLSSLLVAILYTQGESGAAGKLKPIETIDVDVNSTQTSARMLKPLIEALTTTGSGRLNLIAESFEQGAFNDLRLVNYAVAALDDKYGEVGDFVAAKVLPLYGKAIIPQIKDRINIKGTGGSVRRLKLLYNLDPETARPIVLDAFENGSKDMKIAALGCLGDSQEDLPHLLSQAKAKNKQVRSVAFSRLSKFSDDETIELFSQALDSADLSIATIPISQTKSKKLIDLAISKIKESIESLPGQKTIKASKACLERTERLLDCFNCRTDKPVLDLLANMFETRKNWLTIAKSLKPHSDAVETNLAGTMLSTTDKKLLELLANSHDVLEEDCFQASLFASRIVCKPPDVYKIFLAYYQAKVGLKKLDELVAAKKLIVAHQLGGHVHYHYGHQYINSIGHYGNSALTKKIKDSKWDPKWLDAAIEADDFNVVKQHVNAKNKKLANYIEKRFATELKRKDSYDVSQIIEVAIEINHPKATSMVIDALRKFSKSKQRYYYAYWLSPLISKLPAKAAPEIEKILPTLSESIIDEIAPHLRTLKAKKK